VWQEALALRDSLSRLFERCAAADPLACAARQLLPEAAALLAARRLATSLCAVEAAFWVSAD
jgi:hypothetical protein